MNASRREFLRCFAMSAAVAAASGTGLAGLAQAADDNRPDKWVKGVCRYCGTGCGVMVGVKNGKAVAIQGDPNNHNAGLLCLKGSMLIPVLNSRERVTQPMLRRQKGGKLEPVSWDEALDLMAKKFRASIDTYGQNHRGRPAPHQYLAHRGPAHCLPAGNGPGAHAQHGLGDHQ